eukprot:TRINITY_DN61859_c0_g1_i1.p1 TRINITY_DN61859_c0_g1~~TRINITY_DN61859_c0_g1_i1.p1  ORF type:complete len:498 (-),score=56.51 TRINITY_DN61859_c0_g1_i1:5-1498(-)
MRGFSLALAAAAGTAQVRTFAPELKAVSDPGEPDVYASYATSSFSSASFAFAGDASGTSNAVQPSLSGLQVCWLQGATGHLWLPFKNFSGADIRWKGGGKAWERSVTAPHGEQRKAPCAVDWLPLGPSNCVVASVSVLPVRLAQFKHGLRSLLRQTRPPDRVYVVLPQRLKDRTGRLTRRTYVNPLPRFLFEDPRVEVLRPTEEEDLGTLDMLMPTLRALRSRPPPGCSAGPQRVWVVNDDMVYDSGLLEALLACAARHPDAACGATGGRGYFHPVRFVALEEEGRSRLRPFTREGGDIEVQWLQSFGGILYRTDFFDDDFFKFPADADQRILLEADYYFAGYLLSRGVSLLQIPFMYFWGSSLTSSLKNSLSMMWTRSSTNAAKDAAIGYFARVHGIWRLCVGEFALSEESGCLQDISSRMGPPTARPRVSEIHRGHSITESADDHEFVDADDDGGLSRDRARRLRRQRIEELEEELMRLRADDAADFHGGGVVGT